MMMGDQPSVSGSGSTSAMKENVAIVPRRRAVVRVTNDAGEVVDLSNLAQRAEAVTAAAAATATATATATAKKSGVAAPFGPRPHSRHVLTPDDAIARLATDLKNANVAICGAFLQRELLAHQSEWEADESAGTSVVAAWPLTQTMKRFIAALHGTSKIFFFIILYIYIFFVKKNKIHFLLKKTPPYNRKRTTHPHPKIFSHCKNIVYSLLSIPHSLKTLCIPRLIPQPTSSLRISLSPLKNKPKIKTPTRNPIPGETRTA
jgi:hypothetical protein